VTAAEADFVREVRRRHPDAPRPIVIGNCQGGWAAMLLAATNPDITGPIVANGAPLSYWAGQKGKNPMRYLGGLVGGAMSIKLMSDLGHGLFDGSNLVSNFERLSPSNTWWSKYYDLWREVDTEVPRFVGFERWWSSVYYMTEQEIRWIVENLFVGNRLARGCANLDARTHVDLRNINSPIIIFALHGDNITPPQQALGWIPDHYKDVDEIKVRGQRILYTLHENVGHLGIFVSSTIAKKEHQEIVSTSR
jgi:poly(3-hydroxyalkanoate) synthetase